MRPLGRNLVVLGLLLLSGGGLYWWDNAPSEHELIMAKLKHEYDVLESLNVKTGRTSVARRNIEGEFEAERSRALPILFAGTLTAGVGLSLFLAGKRQAPKA